MAIEQIQPSPANQRVFQNERFGPSRSSYMARERPDSGLISPAKYKSSLALIWSITHIHVPTATSLLSTTGSDLRRFETAFFSKDITSIIVIPPSEAHKQHKHVHTVIVVNSFHNTKLQGEQLVKTTLTYP